MRIITILDILVDEGSLRKVEVPDGSNRFDFTLKNHYHVRCVKCGEVSDVDMDEMLWSVCTDCQGR